MKTYPVKTVIRMILVLMCAAVLFSCGKKGLPMAPLMEGFSLQAPYDLLVEFENDLAIVTWKHDEINNNHPVKVQSFDIFTAQKNAKDCKGCPVIFEMTDATGPRIREYRFPVQKGVRYYIRVRAAGDQNINSDYSNTLQFEF